MYPAPSTSALPGRKSDSSTTRTIGVGPGPRGLFSRTLPTASWRSSNERGKPMALIARAAFAAAALQILDGLHDEPLSTFGGWCSVTTTTRRWPTPDRGSGHPAPRPSLDDLRRVVVDDELQAARGMQGGQLQPTVQMGERAEGSRPAALVAPSAHLARISHGDGRGFLGGAGQSAEQAAVDERGRFDVAGTQHGQIAGRGASQIASTRTGGCLHLCAGESDRAVAVIDRPPRVLPSVLHRRRPPVPTARHHDPLAPPPDLTQHRAGPARKSSEVARALGAGRGFEPFHHGLHTAHDVGRTCVDPCRRRSGRCVARDGVTRLHAGGQRLRRDAPPGGGGRGGAGLRPEPGGPLARPRSYGQPRHRRAGHRQLVCVRHREGGAPRGARRRVRPVHRRVRSPARRGVPPGTRDGVPGRWAADDVPEDRRRALWSSSAR